MKLIWKNTFIHALLGIISQALLFVFTAWAARILLPEEFGKFSFSLTYTLFFLIFIEWGTNTYAAREIGAGRIKDAYFLIPFKLKTAFLGYFALFVSTYLPLLYSFKLYILILGLGMIGASFLQYCIAVFQGLNKLRYGSFLLFLQKTIYISFGIILLSYLKSALSLSVSYTLGMVISAIIGIFWVKKYTKPFILKNNSKIPIFKNLLPFVFVRFFSEIYFRIDIIMIQFFLGSSMVGLYALPYKIIESLMLFVNSFVFSLFPLLSHDAEKDLEKLKQTFFSALKLIIIWGIILLLVGLFMSKRAFLMFFGESYERSIAVFYILLFALFFMQVNFLTAHMLLSLKKEKFYAILILITAILNLSLNLWFVPHYKIEGAAITTLLSELFLFFSLGYGVWLWIKRSSG